MKTFKNQKVSFLSHYDSSNNRTNREVYILIQESQLKQSRHNRGIFSIIYAVGCSVLMSLNTQNHCNISLIIIQNKMCITLLYMLLHWAQFIIHHWVKCPIAFVLYMYVHNVMINILYVNVFIINERLDETTPII